MKIVWISLLLIVQACILQAQSKFEDLNFVTTSSGLSYKITKIGEGEYPVKGDKVWVHYLSFLATDSLFSSSMEKGPLDFYLGQGEVIKGWDEGLRLLKAGGSMVLKVPPMLAYGNKEYPGIPANSTLYFEIALLQIDKGLAIEPFITKGATLLERANGLKVYQIKNGEGATAKKGDNAYVHFSAWLNDTSLFDSSVKKGEPVRVAVGKGQVIEGWDLAIQQMNEGARVRVVIPPQLAYGEAGLANIIPPNSIIYMDIELVKLSPEITVKQWAVNEETAIDLEKGLRYYVISDSEGPLIKKDDIVSMHYTGFLNDGTIFDSSVKREEVFMVPAGVGALIDGWEQALLKMRKGGKYQVHIPDSLGYGSDGNLPDIPANEDLIYNIEILDIF